MSSRKNNNIVAIVAAAIGAFAVITAAIITATSGSKNTKVNKPNIPDLNSTPAVVQSPQQRTPQETRPTLPVGGAASDPDQSYTTTVKDVTYKLMDARFEGAKLSFWFTATNQSAQKEICLRLESSLVDSHGNPHQVSQRIVTNKLPELDCRYIDLPYDVPIRFGLIFDTVSPQETVFPILKLEIYHEGTAEIRAIKIPYKR